jgi:hypothetical protein
MMQLSKIYIGLNFVLHFGRVMIIEEQIINMKCPLSFIYCRNNVVL